MAFYSSCPHFLFAHCFSLLFLPIHASCFFLKQHLMPQYHGNVLQGHHRYSVLNHVLNKEKVVNSVRLGPVSEYYGVKCMNKTKISKEL